MLLSSRNPSISLSLRIMVCLASASLIAACGSDPVDTQTGGSGGTGASGGTGGAGGTGGTGGEGGTGGAGGSGGTGGGPTSVCDPPLTEVTPTGTDDVVYADQPKNPCFVAPCLCAASARDVVEQVLACAPVTTGFWAPLGSTYLRVAGREGGACVLEVGEEVEGGVRYSRCKLPLPIEPWEGIATSADPSVDGEGLLKGITDKCELVGSCCILPGCPDPCNSTLPDAPLCPLNVFEQCE